MVLVIHVAAVVADKTWWTKLANTMATIIDGWINNYNAFTNLDCYLFTFGELVTESEFISSSPL